MSDESFPMTPSGLLKLRNELRNLREVERPRNVREIEAAREHGDLRENAEYHAAKETQAMIASRMQWLETRIALANVIDPEKIKSERVGFGATVTLTNVDTDEEVQYTLVGEHEADAEKGLISITSPLARALIGKEQDDEVRVTLPKGTVTFEVGEIAYQSIELDS
jgi:transcription elongation factor GreA